MDNSVNNNIAHEMDFLGGGGWMFRALGFTWRLRVINSEIRLVPQSFDGQGDLVSIPITLISHIVTPVIP